MTTVTLNDERVAVEIAATLDSTRPDYRESVEIALARRGSRDALIVLLARKNEWDQVLDVFHDVRSTSVVTNENIDAIYAAACAVAGSPAIAAAVAKLHPDHTMLSLIGKLIEQNKPVSDWLDRMASLDLDTCYGFNN